MPVMDEPVVEEPKVVEYEQEECSEEKMISYEEYKRMTPLEKT